jgi:hypothetical protein
MAPDTAHPASIEGDRRMTGEKGLATARCLRSD